MFRYYITDTTNGEVKGTNEESIAKDFASSEDYFVVDVQENLWLTENGTAVEIEEYKIEEDEEDE